MANFTNMQDLIDATLQHAGEKQGTANPSSFRSLVVTYMNRAQHEIISGGNEFKVDMGEPWPWAKAQDPGILQLDPPYETGTVTLTKGLATGTFSDAPGADLTGRQLKLDNRPEVFKIIANAGGGAAFTLDANYTDETGSGLTFKAHKLDYTLTTSIMRLIMPMTLFRSQVFGDDNNGKIYGIDLNSLSRDFPLTNLDRGGPTRFAILGEIDGTIKVRFNASVEETSRVEYSYIPIPVALTDSTGSIPIVPREYRIALVYMSTFWLMVDKEDSRSEVYSGLVQRKLQAMVQQRRKEFQHTATRDFGRIIARGDLDDNTRLRTASGIKIL